jgi:hypothetical protein
MRGNARRASFPVFFPECNLPFPRFNRRPAAMDIPLPNGDVLIPDAEFAESSTLLAGR